MKGWEINQQHHHQESFSPEPQPNEQRLTTRGPVWLLISDFARVEPAWAARSTSFWGQWSLGSLLGSLVILGMLVALVVFFMWPRRDGQ